MKTLTMRDCVFPVVGLSEKREPGVFGPITQVYGTAFPIGVRVFVTAGHVLENVLTAPHAGIVAGQAAPGALSIKGLAAHEILLTFRISGKDIFDFHLR